MSIAVWLINLMALITLLSAPWHASTSQDRQHQLRARSMVCITSLRTHILMLCLGVWNSNTPEKQNTPRVLLNCSRRVREWPTANLPQTRSTPSRSCLSLMASQRLMRRSTAASPGRCSIRHWCVQTSPMLSTRHASTCTLHGLLTGILSNRSWGTSEAPSIYSGLLISASPSTNLRAYSDADWAGGPDTRRSTSRYCVYLGDSLISWSSKW